MKNSDKNTANMHFLYLATIGFDNVFKTQILSWLNLYLKEGVDFELVKVDGLSKIFSRQKKEEFRQVRERYEGKAKRLLLPPRKAGLASAYLYFYLYARIRSSNKTFVIQTRTHEYRDVFAKLKERFKQRLSIIYDSRAAKAEEYSYVHLDGNNDPQKQKKYEQIRHKEKEMVALSDVVLCVSNELIKYHMQQNEILSPQKFRLYPGNADAEVFTFQPEIRYKMRRKLGFENKTVIIYSGGLTMPWHLADEMFGFYKTLSSRQQNMVFLLLSGDDKKAEELRKKHEIPQQEMKIISCENFEVPAYLNAADAGLLLRENVPMNNVASPTKFTEYLLCGLPVIISPGVGDFSSWIETSGFGLRLSGSKEKDHARLPEFIKTGLPQIERGEIAKTARTKYAKQAVLPEMIKMYNNLRTGNEN